MPKHPGLIAAFAALLCIALSPQAGAQSYPAKPIRMVIPFAPGGPTDVFARLIGQHLSEAWSQPVVADNRPGATGTLGTSMAVKAPPDGYTLLMASTSSHISAYLYQNQTYDPSRDLDPIINVVTMPFYLVTHPSFPATDVKEVVAELKRRPGFYSYSSPGNGSGGHLVMEMFKQAAGLDIVQVAYKGAGPSITALVAGEVKLTFDTISTSRPQVTAGQLRDYAVTGAARSAAVPDLPTIKESGYPDFEAYIWFGLFAPKGTPDDVVNRINAEVTRIMAMPAMVQRVADVAGVFERQTPAQFRSFAEKDTERWKKAIVATGVRAE
jgi:tripartite-type tricarboxylate transporter receptor subunit TctC